MAEMRNLRERWPKETVKVLRGRCEEHDGGVEVEESSIAHAIEQRKWAQTTDSAQKLTQAPPADTSADRTLSRRTLSLVRS